MKRIFILLLFFHSQLPSQSLQRQVIASAGESNNPQLQWTVGEPIAGIISSSAGSIRQGFQQPQTAAGPTCRIGGKITTESGMPIPNVSVSITGATTQTATTDANGEFCFNNLPENTPLTVRPSRNDNPKNGLTSADLLAIQRHLLNQQLLPSPYKIIAADCNKSASATSADVLVARRVLLNLDNAFSNGAPSWRFVPQSFAFQNALNPFSPMFPENWQITLTAQSPNTVIHFIGIKVGDVNGTATP